jgi:nucleotide-binding universal stress UspA family protein/nitrite reductase/ring-hydroxylating ferredoxin subunit
MDDSIFQTIVLGTDGSPTARIAEDVAIMLARGTEGQVLVVSAFDGDANSKLAAEQAASEARDRVAAGGVGSWSKVVEGEPAAALVQFADQVNAELMIIGDVGMGQARRLRLGGVPDRTTHSASCSILIVRTGNNGGEANVAEPRAVRYRSALIATDGSPTASYAAQVGAAIGRALGANITLAYVGDELMGRIVLRDTAERLGHPDLPLQVGHGEPGKTIARLAEQLGSELVVVGNKGIAGARRVLGSVPNTVSHDAGCDVLIVHTVGRSVADLMPGEGAIVEEKGRKVAAYRDPSGHVTVLSKKCTHLGCSVQWNPTLATWDCPCHGSRFAAEGQVVNGPAQRDLDRIELQV